MEKTKSRVMPAIYILIALNVLASVLYIRGYGFPFIDFKARWQESAWMFHGQNPFVMDPDNIAITAPWAWFLGSFVNPGFLSYKAALVYGVVSLIASLVISSAVVYRYAMKEYKDTVVAGAFALVLYTMPFWWWGLVCFNQSIVLVPWIIIVMCIYREHPYISGVVMVIAMIKPQLAAPFYLIFLFEKNFRLILTSFAAGLASCGLVSLFTRTSFIQLMTHAVSAGSAERDTRYWGLLDPLNAAGVLSTHKALILDMGIGIVYMCVYIFICFRKKIDDRTVLFSGAAIMQCFWFYKQPHDNLILAIVCMALVLLLIRFDNKGAGVLFGLLIYMILSYYVQGIVQRALYFVVPGLGQKIVISIGKSVRTYSWIIIGTAIPFIYDRIRNKNGLDRL